MSEVRHEREDASRESAQLTNLHIAEYEALMTRNSYLMTLQYSLLPAAVLIITLFVPMWSAGKRDQNEMLIWAIYALLLIVGIVWTDTLWEIYNNVWYMERELKPLISHLCGSTAFWGYERHLGRLRGPKPALWELAQPVLAGLLFAVAVFLTWPLSSTLPFKQWKYAAAVFTVLLNARLWWRSIGAIRLRRGFFSVEIAGETTARQHILRFPLWLVPIMTVAIGIAPLILITLISGTLLLSSRVDGPLIAVPTVLIRDLLLLPILNWRIARYLLARLTISPGRSMFHRALGLALGASLLLSTFVTYKWTHDQYFGFIDPTFGRLSFAGWWHFGFTVIEMTLVFTFIFIWAHAKRSDADEGMQRLAVSAWNTFLPYALLSIADFVVLHLYLLPRRGLPDYTPFTASEGLLVIPFWLAVRFFLGTRRRRKSRAPI